MNFIPDDHYRNRAEFPVAELAKYYGKEVAWSLDGTRIIASAADPRDLCMAVQRAGVQSDEVVLAYVPFPEEMMIGGAWLAESEEAT